MAAMRILALCVTAAMICTALRSGHPQIATAVAAAAGIAAMMLCIPEIEAVSDTLKQLSADGDVRDRTYLLRICGIAMIAEFAADICRDAGEAALSRRIEVGVKLGLIAGALPLLNEVMGMISDLLE